MLWRNGRSCVTCEFTVRFFRIPTFNLLIGSHWHVETSTIDHRSTGTQKKVVLHASVLPRETTNRIPIRIEQTSHKYFCPTISRWIEKSKQWFTSCTYLARWFFRKHRYYLSIFVKKFCIQVGKNMNAFTGVEKFVTVHSTIVFWLDTEYKATKFMLIATELVNRY